MIDLTDCEVQRKLEPYNNVQLRLLVDMTRLTYRSQIRKKEYYLYCFEQICFLGNGIKRSSSQKMNASFTRKEFKEFKDDFHFTGNDTECF